MNAIARFAERLSILVGGKRFASELDEEMAFHRTQVEEELIAGGMTPEAAHYAATRQFGNTTKLREQSHLSSLISEWVGMKSSFENPHPVSPVDNR
jgi:hypothetical protein